MAAKCLPESGDKLVDAARSVHLSLGYYPARFPYDVAVRFFLLMRDVMGIEGSILDPFVGSGVSCTSARLHGYKCIGFDINHFALLLATVASSTITRDDITKLNRSLDELQNYRGPGWRPRWSNIDYWYPPTVLDILERLWGYTKSQDNSMIHVKILEIALIRASRHFSYADPDIPKLYRGRGFAKLEKLLKNKTPREIEDMILSYVRRRSLRIANALLHYTRLTPESPTPDLRLWDVVRQPMPRDLASVDIVFTSPPYMAAHEYTRSTKLELYWMGLSDAEVRALKNKEIPYAPAEPYQVESITYHKIKEDIARTSPQLLRIYQNYFWSVTRALDKTINLKPAVIGLFVGPATIKGTPIPIHDILSEHISTRGYTEYCRYSSKIRLRKLFKKRNNKNPYGIPEETLVILKRS